MSASKRLIPPPADLIEDAILDDMLALSAEDIAIELQQAGMTPDDTVANFRRAVAEAEAQCGRRRLAAARQGVAALREKQAEVVPLDDRQRQRSRLEEMRRQAAGAAGMMMAARKSEGLSHRDEDGLLDDLAHLERLEREDGEDPTS